MRPLKDISKAWIHVCLTSVLHTQYCIPTRASVNLLFLKVKFWLKKHENHCSKARHTACRPELCGLCSPSLKKNWERSCSMRWKTNGLMLHRGLPSCGSRLPFSATNQFCQCFHDRLCLRFLKCSQAPCGWDQMTALFPSPVKFQRWLEKGHCFPGMPGLVQERKSSFQQEFGVCLRRPCS